MLIFLVQVLAQWLMDQVPLGHKTPRPGLPRLIHCPACRGIIPTPLPLNTGHVFSECFAVEGTRVREGIRAFIEDSRKLGKSEKTAHSLYVQGMDQNGAKVSTKEHLKRGAALSALTDMWLYTWGEDESA